MNRNHTLLLKKQLRQKQTAAPRRKRRRPNAETDIKQEHVSKVMEESSDSSDDLEDVDLSGSEVAGTDNANKETGDGARKKIDDANQADDSEGSDEFEDLEDVDLDKLFAEKDQLSNAETLTININRAEDVEETGKGKNRRKFVPVSKEERKRRKLIHQLYLEAMVAHGIVRNQWCNDKELNGELKKIVPLEIVELLNLLHMDVLDYVKSRRFIEGIRKALAFYNKKFRVTSQGLVRKDWDTLLIPQERTDGRVSLTRFRRLVKAFRGSRDIGAQGFVALLRSLGVNARLVFSLQPPDYRSIVPVGDKQEQKKDVESKSAPSEFDPVFIPSLKQGFLINSKEESKVATHSRQKFTFPSSKFPLFWIEVWNKYAKKWITVDPIVLNVVEVMPMRRKCKFEAPANDSSSQTWYVIAYDSHGNVRDVTRRYVQYYNAKTVKKRIEFASDEDENWYQRLINAARRKSTASTQADILETKEFYDRDVCEGVPNNMADFKNHPVYALESQLRQDEVIYPKNESSKCGSFRPMNKNTTMTVYKRSHVYKLRTAKAWYMRGRVLKVGVQPLRTKTLNRNSFDDADDDEGIERLYAEFQTEMYRAPPIVDGKITKNAYGNLEIYTPTMMPDNGYLARVSKNVSMKLLEKAARDILKVDYAKAIVAFDFGGTKNKRTPTAREGGIVIDKQYQEAMGLVLEKLEEMEEEEKRRQVELNALRSWKFFMKKLEIMNRLDKHHGRLDDENEDTEMVDETKRESEEDEDEEDGYFSVASDDSSSGSEENYMPKIRRHFVASDDEGGFVVEDNEGGFVSENRNIDNGGFHQSEGGFVNDSGFMLSEGGFEPNDGEEEGGVLPDEGGFLLDEYESEEGRFMTENHEIISEEGTYQNGEPDNVFTANAKAGTNSFSQPGLRLPKEELLSDQSIEQSKSRSQESVSTSHQSDPALETLSDFKADSKPGSGPDPVIEQVDYTPESDSDRMSNRSDRSHLDIKSALLTPVEQIFSPALPSAYSASGNILKFAKVTERGPVALSKLPLTTAIEENHTGHFGHAHKSDQDANVDTSSEAEKLIEVNSQSSSPEQCERAESEHNDSDSDFSIVEVSDDSELCRIEKEERELGLEYSDSD